MGVTRATQLTSPGGAFPASTASVQKPGLPGCQRDTPPLRPLLRDSMLWGNHGNPVPLNASKIRGRFSAPATPRPTLPGQWAAFTQQLLEPRRRFDSGLDAEAGIALSPGRNRRGEQSTTIPAQLRAPGAVGRADRLFSQAVHVVRRAFQVDRWRERGTHFVGYHPTVKI